MKFKNLFFAGLVVGLTSLQACKSKTENKETVKEEIVEMKEEVKTPITIVDVASSKENFSTLTTAIKAADLVETLNSDGPFTVFAPTNDAFAKLPEGTVENLLEPESNAKLSSILTYHVISGKFDAKALTTAINNNNGKFEVNTLQGGKLVASLTNGNVILTDEKGNTSTVVMTDIDASNGIIHAIDKVVMPIMPK